MNRKKLPKVIVCQTEETSAVTAPQAATPAVQEPAADRSRVRVAVSELPSQSADNVVQMIRSVDSVATDPASEASEPTGSPQITPEIAGRRMRALALVDRHAAYSAIGGLVPLALVNFAGVTTIIVRMVRVLCKHYGVPFKHDRARAIVIGLIGGAMPAGAAAVTTSTLLYIAPPIAVLGMAASSATAAVFTRSVGRVFVEHFESGASLDAFSAPQR
jgi:uncharacterized protein (DUF697 family)